ncbi:MAG: diaminopimelate epimerase, partial [Oscillospiraceae bacterium]|nr:diaminopimelate epimerase [Oscillospiraceae bacterium]
EVLGIGKTMAEALYKGLTAAGFHVPSARDNAGVLLSVAENDYPEIFSLAKRFDDLGIRLYATPGTASAIAQMGLAVESVDTEGVYPLMESGALRYIVYTGAVKDATMGDFIALHRRAMQLGIPCLTSLDTADALAQIIASRFNAGNTELVDINAMRPWQQKVRFAKMQSDGNDGIYIENFDDSISCPESLCVNLCALHYGIGADNFVLIERSAVADARMRIFNRDGSEGEIAGNSIRCVAKYLYDKGYVRSEFLSIETRSGVHHLRLFIRDGKVSSVRVDMGKAELETKAIPALADAPRMVSYPLEVGGQEYAVTCVSVGNPHCVVFSDSIDALDLAAIGPQFEYHPIFPERVNTEFVRVVNRTTLRLRVWERGSGETLACGTGACAAVVAAVENGLCDKDADITVKLRGGDLTVRYSDARVTLTGSAELVFEGEFQY